MDALTRLYLTGADGMLGTALIEALHANDSTASWTVRGVSVRDYDIADPAATLDSISEFGPDIVVHAAAHAIVDDCEADPKHAFRVNTMGVRNTVEACRRVGSRLVYISSDYVFDGVNPSPGGYREADSPNPLSVYGQTKLAGEHIVATLQDYLIIRTSWLFGGADERTDNVLATVRQAQSGKRVELIGDQFSCPTYTVDLAFAMVHLLTLDPPPTGTVHMANSGTANWHQVGVYALSVIDATLAKRLEPEAIALDDCKFLGERPRDSTLNTGRLAELGYRLPPWTDAVSRFCDVLSTTA